MKVHYINILLLALPLNILAHNQRNYKISTHHTHTNRSLCECDIYMPNYDNDPQMKEVMDNFNKQTQERFHEYDDRMIEKRKQCKDKCDKEIQKIILKDKLEKQMAQQLTTLDTHITTENIPTYICEKSMADKVEKGCLRCGSILGSAMPELGAMGGSALYGAVINAATKTGMKAALDGLESVKGLKMLLKDTFEQIVTSKNFFCKEALFKSINSIATPICNSERGSTELYCSIKLGKQINTPFSRIVSGISDAAELGAVAADEAKAKALKATFTWETFFSSPLGISLLVTICIIIILSIIYLILRYRRKKKMKKKLQYIKLLEE
ncbi:rifin PIR protein, putative [Plasmodium reichenowi]|uniref:Rifin PIR protein, putative n=1 Tax=Plasmodium reichenowi TaxID=5854 RepID=A0A2P9DST0_PLARE|nr:rifin PIR protein, putative [Plasmodium reichenowi]SOV84189.1 rifin PIR protein, putative [Plasmodium reichenowi]